MRYNILTKHSTKQERIVYEILKELKIPFKHRWLVEGVEADFLIGKIAIEIDGHEQEGRKNERLASLGYIPIHFLNDEIKNRKGLKDKLKNIYGIYKLS